MIQGGELTRSRKFHMIFRSGGDKELIGEMLLEHHLDIFVNGQPAFRCACTPTGLEELVTGRLFAEGIISLPQDLTGLQICGNGCRAEAVTRQAGADSRPDEGTAGSETHATGKPAAPVLPMAAGSISGHFNWKPEWIFHLADFFAEDTGLHRDTACAHSCFLARENSILYSAEDISRHNALDKAVGWALMHQIPLAETILFTSGRLPADIIEKVIRAGIPLIASNAAPTEDAIRLAQKAGIIVIGTVRPEKMRVYTL